MKYFLRKRSRNIDDNPTWPGLVDVFAFGMAIMVILYSLESGKNGDLKAEVQRQADIVVEIRDYQGNKIRELYRSLSEMDDVMARTCVLDTAANVIHLNSIGDRPITFTRRSWTITPPDSARLQDVITKVAQKMLVFPDAALRINGTADPRRLTPDRCLVDNIELSAMRAAAVARILNANPVHIDKSRVRVVGLGEDGSEDISGLTQAQADSALEQYRTVRMDIYIDLNTTNNRSGRQ